jgi:Helix-turn-helix domain
LATTPRELRFVLRDLIMGPAGKSVSTASTLKAYHWLTDHIHDGEIAAFPSKATLARETGDGRSTVIEAIETLVREGWLGVSRGSQGHATRYWMALPAHAIEMLSGDDQRRFGIYTAKVVQTFGLGDSPDLQTHIVQTSGLPPSRPSDHHSPDLRTPTRDNNYASNNEEKAAVALQSKEEIKDHIDRLPPLPIATMTERSAWEIMWPKPEAIEVLSTHQGTRKWSRIVDCAFSLLGWDDQDPVRDKQAWSVISSALGEEFSYRTALLDRYDAGRLTTLDLANVLAVAGIHPPAIRIRSAANEKAA